jgi:4-coumarate--CoA ligase
MIFSPNSMDYPILFLGAQAAGCIASLVNASYMTDELAHQIRDSTPFIIFVHPTLVDILELALTLLKAEGYEVGRVKVYSASSEAIRSVNSDTTYPSYQTLYVEDRDLEDDAPAPAYKGFNLSKEEIDNTPALLCYSSGTVSSPIHDLIPTPVHPIRPLALLGHCPVKPAHARAAH